MNPRFHCEIIDSHGNEICVIEDEKHRSFVLNAVNTYYANQNNLVRALDCVEMALKLAKNP